jgi:two-component system CheB/CheR fusion protein
MHAEDGQVLQISKTWTELTGYAAVDIPTFDAWLTLAYGSGADEVRAHMQQLFRGEARRMAADFDVRTRAGDRRRWSFSASAPGTLRDGRRFIVGMALDVTVREQIENALRESEERLRLVIENAREYAIFSMDLERRITIWNTGAQAILGYTPEEAVGKKADIIFTSEDRAAGAPDHEAATALARGRAADERWHLRKDKSRFWGSGVMTAMHDVQGKAIGLLKIFRDETGAREAQQALEASLRETERARAEAEAADRAKDHFLAVLSHELRTPLMPVLMAVDFLARSVEMNSDTRETLEMIRRNVELESHFIEDLLDVTRIGHGKLEIAREPMDLHEAVRRAVIVSQPDLLDKEQHLTVDLEAAEHQITGDLARLQQVVWNLIKNASKFTAEGGAIRLRTRNEPGVIVVEVADNGIGIEAGALARIFDAFSQANETISRQYGGLGLGLAIAKGTVDAHGGALRADSAGLGHGATFTVTLPLTLTPG